MSNLLKSHSVVSNKETRVIDSNELIASRLQMLSEIASRATFDGEEDEDGFKPGLNAEQLEMLFEDNPDRDTADEGYLGEEEYDAPPVEETFAESNELAQEILDQARAEAESIINDARALEADIKKDAFEQGREEGYAKGHEEALSIIDEKTRELEMKENELREEYEKKLEDMEPMLVDTITDIYEHIFHISLSSNREIMLNLIHDTVRNVEGGKNYIVHISKNDYEYVSARKDQLTDGLGSTDTVEVIEDLTLTQSECFVEAEGGIYDCGIGTELELLKKELMLLSYRKN